MAVPAPYTVKELAGKLFISEPTVRRDIAAMRKKELVDCKRGMVRLRTNSPDRRIPLFIRDMEHNEKKQVIAAKAASHIKDGDIVARRFNDGILPHTLSWPI